MRKVLGTLLGVLVLLASVSLVGAQTNMFRKVNDFDGDGKADFAIIRFENNVYYWWIWQTTAGLKVYPWGVSEDRLAASDYDGDGKTDLAMWRPPGTNGNSSSYHILESATGAYIRKDFFNFIVSAMAHQDYNGDGKTDAAVTTGHGPTYTLTAKYSGSNAEINEPFNGFILRLGDTDGDGRAEISFSNTDSSPLQITMKNHVTGVSRTARFGLLSDQFHMADFDGDGKGDITIFRSSDKTWWWIRSSDGTIAAAQWGIDGDVPVPADYDGDGKTDLAVYRRGAEGQPSYYWIYSFATGAKVVQWGTSTDQVVAN